MHIQAGPSPTRESARPHSVVRPSWARPPSHLIPYVHVRCPRLLLRRVSRAVPPRRNNNTMKGTSALALLASVAGTNAFVAPMAARVSSAARASSSVRMSATTDSKVSNVVDADGLAVRQPPGDVKLDQGVMDR